MIWVVLGWVLVGLFILVVELGWLGLIKEDKPSAHDNGCMLLGTGPCGGPDSGGSDPVWFISYGVTSGSLCKSPGGTWVVYCSVW